MGRFDALKTTIDANIRENGNQEITGEILNLVLNEMVSVVDDEKQDLLMDGVNIKTINGQKILGRGNITIEGGEGGGGGITEEKEVYIGSEEPADAKLWVDTDEEDEPSSPSQPSADNGIRIYELPLGLSYAFTQDGEYTFTEEEAKTFNDVCDTWRDYHYIVILIIKDIDGADSDSFRGYGRSYPTDVFCDSGYMRIQLASPSAGDNYMACNNIKIEKMDDGAVIALPV